MCNMLNSLFIKCVQLSVEARKKTKVRREQGETGDPTFFF